ncbi:MAG: phytanoyl-CoA dioxygenase family protein [Planctomycetes bacterium]|nr:phytanoyl-CoA dioxygenase family protein [Planctomycetota bacterium]
MAGPDLAADGYTIATTVVAPDLAERLAAVFAATVQDRPGVRTGLEHPAVRDLATSPAVRALVEPVLGRAAFAHRATLFDKTPAVNWLVGWHQDLVVPVAARTEAQGFGPWSQKDDGWHVQPPVAVLEELLAVRVDLDGSGPANGGLRVLPGSHRLGVLPPARVADLTRAGSEVLAAVPPRGALLMRPLLLHASSRAVAAAHRRVVHLEFAPGPLPGGVGFRACVR